MMDRRDTYAETAIRSQNQIEFLQVFRENRRF